MSKSVVISGGSGLLGRAVARLFEASGWKACALSFTRSSPTTRKCDITSSAQVAALLEDVRPSLVIHCAAERRPDVVSQNVAATRQLNIDATASFAAEAFKVGAGFIYISTDYVFDGTQPPYKEDSTPNPLNEYGLTKLAGETATLTNHPRAIVLRVPILYGLVETLDESAVITLVKCLTTPQTAVKQSDYERRFPTHVEDVAFVLHQIAEANAAGGELSGIYHWSGDEDMTKFTMTIAMSEVLGISASHVTGSAEAVPGAPRPYNSQLDTAKLRALGFGRQTSFKVGLAQVFADLKARGLLSL